MPGQQWAPFWEGNRPELFATYVLSGIASVAVVPHQFDVGVDLLCTLMRRQGKALYAGRSFGVQVRTGNREFRYGGFDKRGDWRKYQLKWLYQQDAPLLLGVVDLDGWRVRLYSPTRMWWVLLKHFWPGEIVLVPELEPGAGDRDFRREKLVSAVPCGDGYRHFVPLGKPLVDVALADEEAEEARRRDKIARCIDQWVELESRNIRNYKMNIPYTGEWDNWETNEPPRDKGYRAKQWRYISGIQDQHVRQILEAIGPAVASLHHQLRKQNQALKLTQVKPMCELLKEYGYLDPSLVEEFPDP